MKNLLLCLVILFTSFTLYSYHDCNDEHEIRYIKGDRQLDVAYQQYLRTQSLWQEYLSNNGEWYVIFNENNQLPHRAFGKPIPLTNGTTNTDKVLNFLSDNNFTLPSDLRIVDENRNSKHINLSWQQYYNNLEIVNSRLYAKLTFNNELIVFGLDIHNDINISVSATIDQTAAIAASSENLHHEITSSRVEQELKVLPIPMNKKYEYHLVYVVHIETRISAGPANYICYVDANDGELLMRRNTVVYEAPPSVSTLVNVSGEVYTTHPFNPSSVENMVDMKAIDQLTLIDYYTDANGNVNLPMSLGTDVRYKLEGLYADVQTNSSTPDIITPLAATNNIVFDNSNSTIQERTAYYAVNKIYQHFKSIFPNFTALDNPIETNVDDSSGDCNANYNPGNGSINFYAEGGGCNATAKIVDVVYHEYGHAINDNRYGTWGMQNGGLNEGYADVWSISLTENPVLGIGFTINDPTDYIRRYDQNRKVYPQDLVGQVHADGEIIAGAFWDTYLNLGSMPQMIDLFKYTFDAAPDGPNGDEGIIYTDILIEVLYADDNDADLTNGTPNDQAITQAFALHGFTLLSNASITHNPVEYTSGSNDVEILANVVLDYPWALSSANCHYRINDNTTWNTIPMTTSSGSFMTADIPGQVDGSIIAYYISLIDLSGNETGVTPVQANVMPINHANVPYFTLVGYELVQEEDFDFNIGAWIIGDSDDNATTGIWDIDEPTPSYDAAGNEVQTGSQNTLNGSYCAFTGNASSSMASIGENDVDGGHTTLFSPFYNLSGYVNPAFSYYRWYSNNTGAEPNADWWQVLITDDLVNWHYVENNKSSDRDWRKFAFRVKDYVNLTNTVQLKFIASDSAYGALSGGSLVEAAVDDLYLYESQDAPNNITDYNILRPKLIKITDLLGREVDLNKINKTTTLIYIYDDGSIKKKNVIRY